MWAGVWAEQTHVFVTHGARVETHPHLLYSDDVRAKHFKATGEKHDITPAEDQTHRHHLGLPLHLTGSEHQQQHHQAGIADTGQKQQQQQG